MTFYVKIICIKMSVGKLCSDIDSFRRLCFAWYKPTRNIKVGLFFAQALLFLEHFPREITLARTRCCINSGVRGANRGGLFNRR